MFFKKKGNEIIYTVTVNGMMCGMCEAHVNDIIRKNFDVKKVKSSHTKNQTVIVSLEELNEDAIKQSIRSMGYEVKDIQKEVR
ncbi:MAG: cation transporter [Clostridia bacterium]|nr:cation transporter [Clostridia bacterium]